MVRVDAVKGEMTGEVAALVLRENYHQNRALAAARAQGAQMLHVHARYLRKLERAILLGAAARERLAGCTVQVLLTGHLCGAALDWTVAEAAAGGAGMVQLREKGLTDRALLHRAREVRQWTRKAGVLFIVNDRPDVARLVRQALLGD